MLEKNPVWENTPVQNKEPGEALLEIYRASRDPKEEDTAWDHKLKNLPNI